MVQTTTSARPEPSGSAAEARRREILAAASGLFRAKGLHATGMRDIAGALGMTAGNLYYYFPSKQDLLAYCQEATLDELLRRAERTERSDLPSGAKLRRLVAEHVEVLNEATPGSLAHLEIDEVPPARRAALLARRKRYERLFRRRIERGIAEGLFRDVDPSLAALALLGALNWTVKWFERGGRKSASQVGEAFASLLVDGLASDTEREQESA